VSTLPLRMRSQYRLSGSFRATVQGWTSGVIREGPHVVTLVVAVLQQSFGSGHSVLRPSTYMTEP